MAQAEAAVDRLAVMRVDGGFVPSDVLLLRLHALLARAHGDTATYAHFRDRYRDKARTLGYKGHIATGRAPVLFAYSMRNGHHQLPKAPPA